MPEKGALWKGAIRIINDELEYFFFLSILFEGRIFDVSIDHHKVVLSLSTESLFKIVLVGGKVFKQKFPTEASMFGLYMR